MLSTLKSFSALITEETETMTLEEMAMTYREDLNPSLLASAFVKTHKLIISISRKYYGLNQDDLASFSLEELDYCLQSFDPSFNSLFTTYFSRALMNRFREETQALNTHKRKIIFNSQSYETMVDDGFDIPGFDNPQDMVICLKDYGLTNREFEYCELIMQDYSNQDISSMWGVSTAALYHIRQRLKKKLVAMA